MRSPNSEGLGVRDFCAGLPHAPLILHAEQNKRSDLCDGRVNWAIRQVMLEQFGPVGRGNNSCEMKSCSRNESFWAGSQGGDQTK